MCRSHAVHGVHGVQPPSKSHTLTVTTPCRWHVNRKRGRRGREKRVPAYSFPPSHIQQAHTTPHLLSFPPSPSSSLSSTPTTHTHTIISIDLPDNHLHITAPPTQPASPHTHTHTRPKPHPMHVPVHGGNADAAAAAARLLVFFTTSSSCPPPSACHTSTHKQQVVHV